MKNQNNRVDGFVLRTVKKHHAQYIHLTIMLVKSFFLFYEYKSPDQIHQKTTQRKKKGNGNETHQF